MLIISTITGIMIGHWKYFIWISDIQLSYDYDYDYDYDYYDYDGCDDYDD